MPRYSIIIPVYNLANYIEETLKCLSQTNDETEILLINDGSTDSTLNIINRYISDNNINNMRVISQQNQGVSAARNRGIQEATGEYIIFADGDDYFNIEILKKMKLSNADFVVWEFQTDKAGKISLSQKDFDKSEYSVEEFATELLKGKLKFRIGSFAVKRELIDRFNINFTVGCAICEDVEFMYKALLAAKEVQTINSIGYTYVRREGSAMNSFDMKLFQAPDAIKRVYQYAGELDKKFSEFVMDNLEYGLYITHTMYSFDSCCRYINNSVERKQFLKEYFDKYKHIEESLIKAKRNMKYRPEIYSRKRLSLFMFSRKLYVLYIGKQ